MIFDNLNNSKQYFKLKYPKYMQDVVLSEPNVTVLETMIKKLIVKDNKCLGVIDENGIIVACSELVKIGEVRQGVREELTYTSENITSGGYTSRPIGTNSKAEYIVFVEGEDKKAESTSMILSIALSNIKKVYQGAKNKKRCRVCNEERQSA